MRSISGPFKFTATIQLYLYEPIYQLCNYVVQMARVIFAVKYFGGGTRLK